MLSPKTLIERDSAFADLHAAIAAASLGKGCNVLVRGESGIGKSSLLQAWAAQTVVSGSHVLWGGCEALFTPRPLGPVSDLAAGMGADVQEAVRAQRPPIELFAAIATDLQASQRRIGRGLQGHDVKVLVLEDVHWADHLTLDFLKYLGRRVHQWPVVLIASYRDDEVGPMHPLTQVVGELPVADVVMIDLKPLSHQALAQLAGLAPLDALALHRITGGNPFFATEVVASAERGADVYATVPGTVAAAVLARAQRVGADARKVLETASLAPGSMELDMINGLAGEFASEGIDECVDAGLLRWHGRGLAFRHELARRAVEGAISEMRRRAKHTEVYERLRRNAPEAVDRMAYHAQEAHDADAVLATAPRAAMMAAKLGAHREAAAHYKMALQYAHGLTLDARADLLERWAFEAMVIGDASDAVLDARKEALALRKALGQRPQVGMNLRWLARLYRSKLQNVEAEQCLDEAISLFESFAPGRELAWVYSTRSATFMMANDWKMAEEWGNRAIALARQFDAPDVEVHALNNIGAALVDSGQVRGLELLQQSLDLAIKHGLHDQVARVFVNGSAASVRNRMLPQAETFLVDGTRYAKQHDLDSVACNMLGGFAHVRMLQGRLIEAEVIAQEAIHLRNMPPQARLPAQTVLAAIDVVRDVEAHWQDICSLWSRVVTMGEPDYIVPVAMAMIEAEWLRGHHEASAALVEQAVEKCTGLSLWDRGELACWYQRVGRDPSALRLGALAPPCEAEVSGDHASAAKQWAALGMSHHQALAMLNIDPADDPLALSQAIAIFDQMGATALSSYARKLARKLGVAGVKGIKLGPHTAARGNRFGLTTKEQSVATLVAKGLSNQEIAAALSRSPRTVEHHVATVLEKLGAKRRGDVVAILKGADALDSSA